MLSLLFSKNNPLKLYETFLETDDSDLKEKIVQRLIELDSEGYLYDIQKKYSNEPLFQYFFEKYTDDAEKLYQLFENQNDDNRFKIIKQLIELKNDRYLLKLLKTDYENEILPFLLSKYQNFPEKIYDLLFKIKNDNQEIVISKLVLNKNVVELKKVYFSQFRPLLINYLLNHYEIINSDKEEIFLNIHPDFKEELIQKMLVVKAKKENLSFTIDYLQIAVLKSQDCGLKEFILYWEPFIFFISQNISLQLYYFNLLNDKQKLFTLLWHYGIDKYYNVPQLEFPLNAIEHYYHYLKDCVYYNITHLVDKFDEIFSDIVANVDYKNGILAYLIDQERFHKCLEDAEIFIEEMFYEKKEVIEKKTPADRNLMDENEKMLLLKEEISYLIFLKNYHKLKTISAFPVTPPEINIFSFSNYPLGDFFGKKLNIKNISPDSKIVENKILEKLKIEQHRDKLIVTLNDAKSINNIKVIAEKKCSNLLEKNDFIYTLKTIQSKDYLPENIQTILCMLFTKSTDIDIQKTILKCINPELKEEWLKYIHQSQIDLNEPVVVSLFNHLLRNNNHFKNIPLLIQTLQLQPVLIKANQISHVHPVRDIDISKDKKNILSASGDKSIVVYSPNTGKITRFFHTSDIIKVRFDQTSNTVYCAGTDKSIRIFNVLTQELKETVSSKYDLEVLAFSQDGQYIVGRWENSLKIFNLRNKSISAILKYNQFKQNAIITDNMRYLISWSNFEIHITDFLDFSNEKMIKVDRSINSFDLSFDNQYILLGCGDRWKGEIRIYNVETLNLEHSELFDNTVNCAKFSYDADSFAVALAGKDNGEIQIYSTDMYNLIYRFSVHKPHKEIQFWGLYSFLIAYSDKKLEIYDTKKRIVFQTLYFENPIIKTKISEDGEWLLVAEGTETHIYYLLDSSKQSLFSIIEHLLQLKIEQNTDTNEYILNQKENFKYHPIAQVRQNFQKILRFVEL